LAKAAKEDVDLILGGQVCGFLREIFGKYFGKLQSVFPKEFSHYPGKSLETPNSVGEWEDNVS